MSTIALWVVIVVIAIIILAKLPGVEHIFKPLFETFFKLIQVIFEHSFVWIMFVVRNVYYAHKDFLFNLFNPRHKVLPEERIKEINKRGGIE